MIRQRTPKILLALLLALPLLLLLPHPAAAGLDEAAATYELRSEEKAREQERFLQRLKQDKTKIDLAIENTKSLIDKSRQRPYLPELYLRLAELYIEKSRTVYFIRKAELPEGGKSLNHLESNTLKKQALEVYQRILSNFPEFKYRPKVHFFMAHEFRELGQIDEMLQEYKTIIRKYPASAYAAESYLLLGDHFFTQQELDLAKRHYQAVLGFSGSPALAIARYKLAWCYINEADYGQALELFEAAVKTAGAEQDVDIDTYRKVDIKLESLIDLAFCYVEQYKEKSPREALDYFETLSWSRPVYMVALEKLAYRYFIKKKWQHSGAIYRTLAALENDPEKLLLYAGRVFECVRAIGTFEHADRDMALIVKALETQKYSTHIADEVKEKNAHEYELYARDIVTHLHQKALKGKSAEGFRLAAAAYRNYLDFFDASEAYDEMAMNYAETLFSAEDYLEAGKQFETLAGSRVRSERERRDGLYSAVLSYYLALKNTEDLSAYEKVYARSGLRAVGKTYTAEYPRADKVPNVLFNVAWVAYNEGKYGVAIDEFSRFVTAYPQSAEAKAAVHLILDAYNLTEDYEGLVAFGRGVLKNGALDRDLKAEVAGIVQASESKVLNPLALAAVENWDQGKKGLIAFAEKHQSSSLGEQALQAVVASSSELRDLPTLFGAADDLLRKYPQSSKVEETLNLVIETCLNASQFRRLAASLEEFARRLPRHASSADFLYQAAQIRQGLGQYRLANADYAQLLAGTSAKYRDKVEIVWTLVENNLKLGDDRGALRLLLEREGKLQGTSRTRAQATIAELYRQGGDGQGAAKFRKAARIGFEKNGGDQDPAMKDALAGMEFGFLAGQYRDYMDLQLGGSIDDAIVRRKGDLLGSLLKGYHKVMKLQSPEYALAACNRACEVNHEFARFLRGAPLPELTPEQQEQYAGIVAEKAAGYEEKGDDYLQNAIEMARKWEICDAELAAYFRRNGGGGQAAAPTVETGPEWLADPGLKGLHLQALEKPGDPGRLQALAVRYLKRGDYRHAILIAQRALEGAGDDDPAGKASLYNTLGVAYLYCNEDQIAKDAFHKAIACQADHRAARVNLAGLYQYYEHMGKARTIYMDLGVSMPSAPNDELIHPRSREYYHAFNRFAQQ